MDTMQPAKDRASDDPPACKMFTAEDKSAIQALGSNRLIRRSATVLALEKIARGAAPGARNCQRASCARSQSVACQQCFGGAEPECRPRRGDRHPDDLRSTYRKQRDR
jgi:hypothetical protein